MESILWKVAWEHELMTYRLLSPSHYIAASNDTLCDNFAIPLSHSTFHQNLPSMAFQLCNSLGSPFPLQHHICKSHTRLPPPPTQSDHVFFTSSITPAGPIFVWWNGCRPPTLFLLRTGAPGIGYRPAQRKNRRKRVQERS